MKCKTKVKLYAVIQPEVLCNDMSMKFKFVGIKKTPLL